MRIKVDENLPPEAAQILRAAGHEADSVVEEGLQEASDSEIADVFREEGRALITLDSDFADIRTYPPSAFPGLVVMRLQQTDKRHVLTVLTRLLPSLRPEDIVGKLWIVQEHTARIHE